MRRLLCLHIGTLLVLLVTPSGRASAQVDGSVSLMVDAFPDVATAPREQTVSELRTRVFLERRDTLGPRVRLQLSGYVDGLLADRSPSGESSERTAIVRPGDLYVEYVTERFELRGGASRIVWGRLDEFQPTDVVNPIDLSRFLLEGRSEARLPVGVARARVFLPHSSVLEAVAVPAFRAGTFDQLAEHTSPFNVISGGEIEVERREPDVSPGNLQGGARFTSTTGRVDWAVAAYRGFRPFATLTLVPTFAPPPRVIASFPRFTMVGGDFETVSGRWGVRGEVAAFVEDELQSSVLGRGVAGRTVEGGMGVDRKAGSYRISGDVLLSHRRVTALARDTFTAAARDIAAAELNGTDVMLVLAADRSFARETRTLRVFAAHDPTESTSFARLIAAISLRDDVWIEASGGLFVGESSTILGRLSRRDFVYARVKVFF